MARYTVAEVQNNQYYQLPKFLFEEKYKGLTSDAKILYSLLRDRHDLSLENNWINEENQVYMIYTREDMEKILGKSNKTIIKIMKDLKKYELIDEEQHGQGNPNYIYLSHPDVENTKTCKNYTSKHEEITCLNVKKVHAIKTKSNKTDNNNIKPIVEQAEKTPLPFKEIIEYLNMKVGGHYSFKTEFTHKFIIARIKEGFTLENFKTVINKKSVEWLFTEQEQYLRPQTLFGTNFEGYLNQNIVIGKKDKGTFNDFEQRNYDYNDLENHLLGNKTQEPKQEPDTNAGVNDLKNWMKRNKEKGEIHN